MATHPDRAPIASSGGPAPAEANHAGGKLIEYEQFIESQLRRTRSHVRSVDLGGGFLMLVVGTLAYFFVAAIVDHWVIPGGLGFWGRLLFLITYAVATIWYLSTQVLPLFVRRINPVYAAHTIERSRPSLKNALVNFLLFRANPAGLSDAVYQAIEEQAATNLAKVHVEAAVDRSKLIHIGYALLGILFVCAIYTLLSPKNLLQTVGRVVMPWAEISVPTRTSITEIEPGDAEAFRGQQVTVKARVEGLAADGKVMLYYSTADGQIVDRAVEMNLPLDGYKHACVLPSGDSALQQSLGYRIEAGDAVSRPYRLAVVAAPTIVVRGIRYKYPAYTGLVDQRVERQGDIKAIEGTEVTIEAVANQDIQSAAVDFDCDNQLDQRMRVDRQQAEATFRLALKGDRRTPEHNAYQLIFKNEQGRQNPQPVRHEIEVTRDVPPEIQFVAPKQDEIDLPANAVAQLEIVAEDPDFALRLVKLSATSGRAPLFDQLLLNEVRRGQFVHKFRFEPRKLGLKAGDLVEYWASAEDSKDPRPNRSETTKRRIRIVSPSQHPPNQDQVAENGNKDDGQQQPGARGDRPGQGDHPRDNDNAQGTKTPEEQNPSPTDKPKENQSADDGQRENKDGHGEEGQGEDSGQSRGSGKQSPGNTAGQQPGDQPDGSAGRQGAEQGVPSDGSDDGDAFERILKHRDDQGKSRDKSSDPRQQRPAEKQDSGDQQGADRQNRGPREPDKNRQSSSDKSDAEAEQGHDQKPPRDDRRQPDEKAKSSPDAERGEHGDQAEKPEGTEGAQGQPPREPDAEAEKSGEKPQPPRSKSQPEKRDPSQGQRGAGSGDDSTGGDPSGGQQGQQGQKPPGQQDQAGQGKQPGKEQGQGGKPGDRSQGAGRNDASRQGDAGGDKPTDSAAGDDAKAEDSAQQGKGRPQGQGTPREKPAGSKEPQTTEQADSDRGKPQSDGGTSAAKPESAKTKQGDKPEETPDDHAGSQSTDDVKSDQKPSGTADKAANRDRHSSDSRDNHAPNTADPAGNNKSGEGAQSKGDPTRPKTDQQPSRDKQKPDARGGDGEHPKGQSGAGQESEDNKGSPSPTDNQQPREKTSGSTPDEKDPKKDDNPQSPSHGNRESDSQGADDGDRAGGGKRGGGQKANKSGTGGAGQNTAADEGAGRSDEAGQGENSDRAGQDRPADKKTGQGGSQPGQGSSTRPSAGEGGKPGDGTAPQGAQPESPPSGTSAGKGQGGKSGSAAGNPTQGGQPAKPAEQTWRPTPDEAEEANLEYTRKATDLALEHLKDQLRKEKPDPKLLDRLGWTRTDLENFVQRWEHMRKQAQAPGDQGAGARQQLDETLRSLGLRPRATSIQSNVTRDDQSRGYNESRRSSPPPEYAEQFKAYTQGTARGGE